MLLSFTVFTYSSVLESDKNSLPLIKFFTELTSFVLLKQGQGPLTAARTSMVLVLSLDSKVTYVAGHLEPKEMSHLTNEGL